MSAATLRTVSAAECAQKPPADKKDVRTIDCPECGKSFFESAVISDQPIWDPVAGQHKCRRGFYCDHCDIVIAWFHLCSAAGHLGPRADDDPPSIIRGQSNIDRFLNKHPECRGILHEERP